MIAFFQSSCPSGWSDIDSSKRGYLLVVDPNGGTTAGTIVGSALSNQQNPQHNHAVTAGTFCINSAISAALVIDGCTTGCLYSSLKPLSSYTICENSAFNLGNSASGYPFVQLRLCKATSLTSQVEVPANTVAYFDSSVNSCPTASGWSDYTAAHGRVLVPQTKNTAPQTSSSSALTSGQTLSHKHSISTTVTNLLQSNNQVYNAGDKSTIGNLNGATTRTVDVQTSNLGSTDLGIGYVQLTACVAGATSAPTYIPPPSGAMLFTSTSSCSSDGNWNPVEDAFLNRLVVSLPTDAEANNAATWGGSAIVPPNDVTHTHSVPATTLDFVASDWQSNSASASGTGAQLMYPTPTPTPSSVSVPTFTSATNTDGSIPYLALGLCRSTGIPTTTPTKNPVTGTPTKAPVTTSPTSKSPTNTPTSNPTPPGATQSPTMNPIKVPTNNPVFPTPLPTTKAPTKKPTGTPTTNAPSSSSGSPTMKPQASSLTAAPTPKDDGMASIIGGAIGGAAGFIGLSAIVFVYIKRRNKSVPVVTLGSDNKPKSAGAQINQQLVPSTSIQIQPQMHPIITPEQTMRISAYSPNMISNNVTSANFDRLITMYPFEGETDAELKVPAGLELIGIAKEGVNGEWIVAMNPATNQIGLIPTSYVRAIQ